MSLEREIIQEILDTKNTWLLNIIFQVLWETSVICKVKELESSFTAYTHNRFGRVGFDIWGISLALVETVPIWCKGFVFLSSFSVYNNMKRFFVVKRCVCFGREGDSKQKTALEVGFPRKGVHHCMWYESCHMEKPVRGWHCQNPYLINLRSEIKNLILDDTPWQCASAKQKTSKASLKICCPFLPLRGDDSGSLSVGRDSELDFHWSVIVLEPDPGNAATEPAGLGSVGHWARYRAWYL